MNEEGEGGCFVDVFLACCGVGCAGSVERLLGFPLCSAITPLHACLSLVCLMESITPFDIDTTIMAEVHTVPQRNIGLELLISIVLLT